ncbi:PAAR motif family protein [Escherichia coli 2-005-03_S4_C3]|nr:PAAR motif family protein [Escherichia coli 2-005-03_S4_C3]KDT28220.1 PAAR motif family protein [Escherichia coli 2-052-05_S4_C1]
MKPAAVEILNRRNYAFSSQTYRQRHPARRLLRDRHHRRVIHRFIDGLPAARQGDPLTPHDKPKHPPHPRKIARGSSTVFIDGLPAARTGDAIDCGGVVIGGGTVNIG